MPLNDVKLRAGIDRENTPTSVEGTWVYADKVRFRGGTPEKIGGWQADAPIPNPVGVPPIEGSFWGTARHLYNWLTLARYNMLGIGTSTKYYIQNGFGGTLYDVTPITSATAAGGVTFAATNGSTVLTVTDAAHPAVPGDFVIFSGAVSLGGVITAAILNKEYVVATVIGVNSYTVTLPIAANASDTGNGGGAAIASYELLTGPVSFIAGAGWGAGGWGGVTGSSTTGWGAIVTTGVAGGQQPRLWSASNFGERLIVNPRGNGLYLWTPNVSPSIVDRMVLLTGGDTPTVCNYVLVSDASRFVLAFGVNDYGSAVQDPMLVRWSDQESYTVWTPDATNQAGSYRLSRGSVIFSALQTRQEVLVWTDAALYSMQYQGPPFVWSTNILGDKITIMGPNATVANDNIAYWMGTDKFYIYNGRIDTLPCSVLRFVFSDINLNQRFLVHAGHNSAFQEVWWYYCSASSDEIDRYVIYNYLEQTWSVGALSRTAWLGNNLRNSPIATSDTNLIMYHEIGTDDNGVALASYVESAPMDIDSGQHWQFIRRMQPDVSFTGSMSNQPAVLLSLKARGAPGAAYGPPQTNAATSTQDFSGGQRHLVEEFTNEIYPRLRGQQVQFKIESAGAGVTWQLGVMRIDNRPDGRK